MGGGGGGFSIFISYTYLQFHRIITIASFSPFSHSTLINIHYSSLIIGINLAMETSYIRTKSNFLILVKTPLIFPIPWAPAPFPKRGVIALTLFSPLIEENTHFNSSGLVWFCEFYSISVWKILSKFPWLSVNPYFFIFCLLWPKTTHKSTRDHCYYLFYVVISSLMSISGSTMTVTDILVCSNWIDIRE